MSSPHKWKSDIARMPPRDWCARCGVVREFNTMTGQTVYTADWLVLPVAGEPQCKPGGT